jgi:hypothetical protein
MTAVIDLATLIPCFAPNVFLDIPVTESSSFKANPSFPAATLICVPDAIGRKQYI